MNEFASWEVYLKGDRDGEVIALFRMVRPMQITRMINRTIIVEQSEWVSEHRLLDGKCVVNYFNNAGPANWDNEL